MGAIRSQLTANVGTKSKGKAYVKALNSAFSQSTIAKAKPVTQPLTGKKKKKK